MLLLAGVSAVNLVKLAHFAAITLPKIDLFVITNCMAIGLTNDDDGNNAEHAD